MNTLQSILVMNIIKKIVYGHLSSINRFPKGMPNRFQKTADKWVQSLNHPQIKTFHQFYLNQQTNEHQIKLLRTQQQQLHLKQISEKDRTGLFRLFEALKLIQPYRADDLQPSKDTKDMTIWKFIKQAVRQRKQHHKFPFYVIASIILYGWLYFKYMHGKGSQFAVIEKLGVLNPEVLQTYQFQHQQKLFKQIKQRIELINNQYLKQLQLARM